MTTERLYYGDSYLTEFQASVTGSADGGRLLYLDRTALYPSSGGQPNDLGMIAGVPVLDVVDEGERIAHVLARPLPGGEPAEGTHVCCCVDWSRRFDHMQQHTGQHLLSAVLVELYDAQTVGFHLSAEYASIDVAAAALDAAQIAAAELRVNALVFENRAVTVTFEENPEGLRKESGREGLLRIVTIDGFDRSACGGTHVRATGEIGPVLLRKIDRAHGNVRIEFVCGMRAIRRARMDFDALARIARVFSSSLDEAPAAAEAEHHALAVSEKARRKLSLELAQVRGRELYAAAAPGAGGLRRFVQTVPKGALDDEIRATAQAFAAGEKAVFVAAAAETGAVLIAASADSGVHAGNFLKAAVTAAGGRGGGNSQFAQGGVPDPEKFQAVLRQLSGEA